MVVPYAGSFGSMGYGPMPLRVETPSCKMPNDGASEIIGVRKTRGGAGVVLETTERELGFGFSKCACGGGFIIVGTSLCCALD